MRTFISLVFLVLIGSAGNAFAYPSEWTNYDPGDLDAVRDATITDTQNRLEERDGQVECIACHGELNDTYDGVIDTFEIVDQTMSAALSCMDWEIRGACIWMTCAAFVCWVDTSIKVKNFVPDLVVQSYDRAAGEPWTESQDINQISMAENDSSWVTTMIGWVTNHNVDKVEGGRSNEATRYDHVNLDFKLVDSYGNPALVAYNTLAQGLFGMVCAGRTFPFYPYFISNLDSIAWRWHLPEFFYPISWAVGMDRLGSGHNSYGGVFPRSGFLTQADGLKSGVLTAFRAMHFVTRPNEPHLYFTIGQPSEDGYWPPGPLNQNDKDTGVFQMLYPQDESSCQKFPYGATPSMSKRSDDDSYVWNFWRAYKCCQRRGSSLIWHSG
ncbi:MULTISPECIES: TIGR03756 family integrating conjugative element protein [Marinobacter]|jgi:integrating conjugative element protein (TIGR03756 family)|uniref:TraU protein n=2 Tax=Marinobacter TaxID=2742 RepID=W5YU88_9GAMM|nr:MULTISPECIES: TIGR03756 family integrating conjugative element protein [Marinobacter]MCP4063870.1 TIGR03756 family integrating conjugative element protein [Gammaproteobacteria bacterium]AHI32706.1 hypothetical protein AU15_20180 [Marinobacter salarius]AZR43531.1 hypothetical protein MTMN5_04106 [Marinobacter salarius]MBL3558787.1 TIGR03756 family integrating conjugative element protein [Marinobacter sp. JB05H06]ODM31413.1 integrating conjugative element protein [Marinobacter adhaerens]|tara:strand:+ start:337 stop:1482 length:1146 start_codon:yes stop_codon:yes gene_type:complete